MKKVISLVLVLLFMTVGCGKNDEKDFYLTYHEKDLFLNREYNEDIYGKSNDSFESESCAFGNKDITYMYDDIEIEAYGNDDGKLIVYSIYFTGDDVSTNEGIKLYDEIDDAIKVYGNDYTKEDNKYTYYRNNTSLIFITENDIIRNIEYRIRDIA